MCPQAMHLQLGMTLLIGLVLCVAVVDSQTILHNSLQGDMDVTNQLVVAAEGSYTYLTCAMDGGSTQWLFQNGTTVPMFQHFTQLHTRQGVGRDNAQYLSITPFAPSDQGFYLCISVKDGLQHEVNVGLFLKEGVAPRDVTIGNVTTDGFTVQWSPPAVGVQPVDGFLVQAFSQGTGIIVESTSLGVDIREYQFICLQSNSEFTVSVSTVYGTLVKDSSPLLEVNTTAGVRPEVCSTSDNSSIGGPVLAIPAPEDVTANALLRPGAILVTWSVPTRPIWLAITGYTVTVTDVTYQQEVERFTTLPSVLEAEVTGLMLGRKYEVKVALDTSRGEGMYSNSTSVITYNVPEKVVNVSTSPDVSGGEATIRTHWISPRSDVTISHYIIKYTLGGVERDVTSTREEAVEVVQRGQVYLVAVAAASVIGVGKFSEAAEVKSYDVPEIVSVNVTSTSSTSISLHWVVEQSMQHQLPILYYNLTYSLAAMDQSSDSIALPSNASLHRVIGLTPDTEYTMSLSAHNRLGTGLKNTHTVATSKAPPPGHVTATPLARPGQIYINWTQPPSELQGFTRGYLVRYKEQGTADRHMQSDTSSYMNTILTGLKIGTVYELEVAYVIPTIGLYSPPVLVQTFDVPQVVTEVALTAGVEHGSPTIKATWNPPYSDVSIDSYDVTVLNSSGSPIQQVSVQGDVTSVVIGALERGREHQVSVMAVSTIGKGKNSQPVRVKTFDVPAAPKLLSVLPSVRDHSPALNLSWSLPHSDIPLMDFVVEYWMQEHHVHSVVTNRTSTTLSRLALGAGYTVHVAARSALGQGHFSALQNTTTLNVPPEVGNVTVLPSVANQTPALKVSWEPPTYSLPIAYYRVYLRSLGLGNYTVEITNGTMVTMDMLDRGVEYEVYITAMSVLGEGQRGQVHRAVTFDVPGPPGDIRKLLVEDDSVMLYWCAADQRNSALQYVLVVWNGSKVAKQFTLDDPFYRVGGLDSNTQYLFSVRATNELGLGAEKNITVRTLPGRPVRLEVVPISSTALKAQWLPPVNHERGSVVYDVQCNLVYDEDVQEPIKKNESFIGISRTNLMLTSLLSYKVYVVIVTARNEEGSSRPRIMQARTFSAVPSAPPIVSEVQILSPYSAAIHWSPPAWQHRNGDITSYTVSIDSSEGDAWQTNVTSTLDGAVESIVWTDLYQNGHFVVEVAATNVNGTGPFSKALNFATPLDVPGQPQDLHVQYTNTSAVAVQWNGSTVRNDHVERYHVIYMVVDNHVEGARNGTKVVNASQMHCLLSGLDEYREYSVMIAGVNTIGHGTHSSTLNFLTYGKEPSGYPSVLGYPLILPTSIQIHIAEMDYLDQNGPVTHYILHYAPLSNVSYHEVRNVTIETSDRMVFHLQKLLPFTKYRFQIQGVSDFGMGPLSPFADFMTAEDVPGPPQDVQVQSVNDSCIHVRAQSPTARNGVLTHYLIEVGELDSNQQQRRNVSTSTFDSGLEHMWCDLEPEVPYEVHVSASTRIGCGPSLSAVFFTREGAAPHSVSNVTIIRTTDISVTVSWEGLTFYEAKGFPMYKVWLKTGDESGAGDITMLTPNTSAAVVDIDPATAYEISVTVYTGAGIDYGTESERVLLPAMPQTEGKSANPLDSLFGIPHLPYYIIGGGVVLLAVACLLCVLCQICCCMWCKKKRFQRPNSGSFSPQQEDGLSAVEANKSAYSLADRETAFCGSSYSSNYQSAMVAAGCPDEAATANACDVLSGQNKHAFSMI